MDNKLKLYILLCLIIAFVTFYDASWIITPRLDDKGLYEAEINPIGLWLIDLDGGGRMLFFKCKIIGSCIALTCLGLLYYYKYKHCWAVVIPMTIFQILLFFFLQL